MRQSFSFSNSSPPGTLTRKDAIVAALFVLLCGSVGTGAYYGSVWLTCHEEIEYQLKGGLRWVADLAAMLVAVGAFVPIFAALCFGVVLAVLFSAIRSVKRKFT